MSVYLVHDAETAEDQAIAWILRLQGETPSVEDGLEFDAWLDARPANADAYAQLLSLLEAVDVLSPQVREGMRIETHGSARHRTLSRWAWGTGIAGVAAAAALVMVILPQGDLIAQTSSFATPRGEHRSVKLADGSTIDMNAETVMSVTLAPHERRVVMGQGEAVFDIAHDKARAFEIEAGDRLVHVVGTQFDVRNRPEGFSVTVSRGTVQVRGPGPTYVLNRGDRLDFSTGGEKVSRTDPAEALGWRTGRLVYRDQPLSRVVADLNREFPRQVIIADEHVAGEKVSGVLVLDDQTRVLERLALMLPLKTVMSDQGVVLQSK